MVTSRGSQQKRLLGGLATRDSEQKRKSNSVFRDEGRMGSRGQTIHLDQDEMTTGKEVHAQERRKRTNRNGSGDIGA